MARSRKRTKSGSSIVSAPVKRARKHEPEQYSVKPPQVAGNLYVWGENCFGQLGLGSPEDGGPDDQQKPALLKLGDSLKVVDVDAGGMHTIALAEDGSVWTWGTNDGGELGRKSDGSAWSIDRDNLGDGNDSAVPGRVELPSNVGKVVSVCAGDGHSHVLTADGCVWGFGLFRNSEGNLGFGLGTTKQLLPEIVYKPLKPNQKAVKIASGNNHVAVLLANGAVLTFGDGERGQLGRLGPRSFQGRLGQDRLAAMLVPQEIHVRKAADPVVDIMCGDYCTILVTEKSQVYVFGLNNYNQLGVRGESKRILHHPTKPRCLQKRSLEKFAPSETHTLALGSDGVLYSLGRGILGCLGHEDLGIDSAVEVSEPRSLVMNGAKINGIAVGADVSGCFHENSLLTWGCEDNGLLGQGEAEAPEPLPKKAIEFSEGNIVHLGFGGQHAVCLVSSS